MGTNVKIVERTAHIQLFTGRGVHESDIHLAAPAVPGIIGDITLIKQQGFVYGRIKILFHLGIAPIRRP